MSEYSQAVGILIEDIVRYCVERKIPIILNIQALTCQWTQRFVNKTSAILGFKYADFDGCRYGYRAQYSDLPCTHIRMPLSFLYFGCDLGKYLYKRCDDTHRHASCSHPSFLYAHGYTNQMVKCITDFVKSEKLNKDILWGGGTYVFTNGQPSPSVDQAISAVAVCAAVPCTVARPAPTVLSPMAAMAAGPPLPGSGADVVAFHMQP